MEYRKCNLNDMEEVYEHFDVSEDDRIGLKLFEGFKDWYYGEEIPIMEIDVEWEKYINKCYDDNEKRDMKKLITNCKRDLTKEYDFGEDVEGTYNEGYLDGMKVGLMMVKNIEQQYFGEKV